MRVAGADDARFAKAAESRRPAAKRAEHSANTRVCRREDAFGKRDRVELFFKPSLENRRIEEVYQSRYERTGRKRLTGLAVTTGYVRTSRFLARLTIP